MDLFNGQNLLEFSEGFKSDENCKEYLANFKWEISFQCLKCKHKKSQIRKDFSKTCNQGRNFMALDTMIHQVKLWIRTIYSSVSDFNINRYFDEFCYRINRSQSKKYLFNNLIKRMVKSNKIYQTQIICS